MSDMRQESEKISPRTCSGRLIHGHCNKHYCNRKDPT
jgi:hypothetical protein